MESNSPSESPAGPPLGAPAGPAPGPDVISKALNIPAFGQQYAQIQARRLHKDLAIWFVDIRNFRSINPKLGFQTGNLVLQIVASCMRSLLAHDLPVARLGGDRFVVLTADMDFEQARVAFAQVRERANQLIAERGIKHLIDLCGGVYYLQESDMGVPSFQTPLDYASIAHRNAHGDSTSASLACFTQADLERDMRRITIEQSIDEALIDGQIEVWYQPQIDYALGEVIGAEALARWNHPDLGWISPSEFIPVLENCGRVHDLDLYVWEEACRSAGRWRSVADGKPVPISVNVSRAEMFEPGLLEHFVQLQERYDLPKGSLRLEVTESAFVEEASRLYSVIDRMRKHDLLVEMDDFGSGLSSLNMLRDVPVDVVKLDMGFMQNAIDEDRGGVILSSVIRMLQGLDTPIIAEGVETLEQAEMLRNMGCHLMQGFHFSRPMPLADFEDFIATNRAVEQHHRMRSNAHVDDLMSIDVGSSYLFNHAMGPTMFFFASEGTAESILVNDEFYEACGLKRDEFGNSHVNPIAEVNQASRATMWRAGAEAREYGAARCRAEIDRTNRWMDAVIRYLGTSARGEVYSINVIRSGNLDGEDEREQLVQDLSWDVDMLDAVVPNTFVKCKVGSELAINYLSPKLYRESGLSESEFIRRFHNALDELVVPEDRADLMEAVAESRRTGKTASCEVAIHYGYGSERRDITVLCRTEKDHDGETWMYGLLLFLGEVYAGDGAAKSSGNRSFINLDYDFARDCLVMHGARGDGAQDYVVENFVQRIDEPNEAIGKVSAAKVIAMISDLRQHPTAGFSDIKCDLRGEGVQRWYHVNFVCEADEDGNAIVIHGYAQDANDQMGSVRWWRQQAEIDQLTGLLNRNAVEQKINVAVRTQGEGMMFMIDLDGFKQVNDELGHLAGDALLRDVAGALRRNFREGDVLGRYGGDEFVAFMAVTGRHEQKLAKRRAESIIASVKEVNAACSVGVAICHDHNATFYDLLEAADEAMYHSKEHGRGTYTIRTM